MLLAFLLIFVCYSSSAPPNSPHLPALQPAGNTPQLLSLISSAAEATNPPNPGSEARLSCLFSLCGRLSRLWGPTPAVTSRLWELVSRRLVKPPPPGPATVVQLVSSVP